MGEKLKIGQIISIKRRNENEAESKELYQVIGFNESFVECCHIKGGYRETFSPHDLYINGILNWWQVLEYKKGNLTAVCEV